MRSASRCCARAPLLNRCSWSRSVARASSGKPRSSKVRARAIRERSAARSPSGASEKRGARMDLDGAWAETAGAALAVGGDASGTGGNIAGIGGATGGSSSTCFGCGARIAGECGRGRKWTTATVATAPTPRMPRLTATSLARVNVVAGAGGKATGASGMPVATLPHTRAATSGGSGSAARPASSRARASVDRSGNLSFTVAPFDAEPWNRNRRGPVEASSRRCSWGSPGRRRFRAPCGRTARA